ncbi:hypothetical protein BJ322DRAFT_704704 [Thelephora terrestris]|uniref:Uncharacterized protein n=1 Tax=Thelephora terrestris TaxID=56493 RepID=A0A9P6L8H6_9AGAM|nr:hypothetical protein BJ322DRAFT_704704 [Thelephora terrestris]
MSSSNSGLPSATSSPRPTSSLTPPAPSSTPSSPAPSMSSTTTPTTTSQPPSTSLPPSTTSSPPSTSNPPSTTSHPPSTSTTSVPPETTSESSPTTTSILPSTTTTEPRDTSTTFSSTQSSSPLIVISTYQSTVFVTTTDQHGSTVLSAPSAFTSTLVSTNSMGQPITVTQIINNPTLIPNASHGGGSAFFQNKGAVTGVFVVVGLTATAVAFFVIFFFRRRRKNRRRDHDTAVAATLAEHGLGRQALIGPDDHHPVSDSRIVITPTGSGSSADTRRTSSPSTSLSGINPGPVTAVGFGRQPYIPPYRDDSFGQISFNPYADNQAPYRPHQHPGPSSSSRMHDPNLSSVSGVGLPFFGHGPKHSMGSTEPLLAAISDRDPSPDFANPIVPPRNPRRTMGGAGGTYGDTGGRGTGGILSGESVGYRDDDGAEYEGLRKGSLRTNKRNDVRVKCEELACGPYP